MRTRSFAVVALLMCAHFLSGCSTVNRSTVPSPSTSAMSRYAACPTQTPLPPGPQARASAEAAARRELASVYGNPSAPTTLHTTGYRVTRVYAAEAKTGLGAIPSSLCGPLVGTRTWIVELDFLHERPSASMSQGQVFVARFADGWHVWYRYH